MSEWTPKPGDVVAVKARGVRVISGHTAPGETYHELVNPGTFYGDSLGRPNGATTMWLVVRCNNRRCAAHVLVREDIVTAIAENALAEDALLRAAIAERNAKPEHTE